jgi:hypothetical protein
MTKPVLIDERNVSCAWANAFLTLRHAPGHRLAPLTLSFSGFDGAQIIEEPEIRSALDAVMRQAEMQKIQTVASTIFPQALWNQARGNRQALYAAYRENLPEYVAMEPHKNRSGLYFGRLIAYDVDHKTGQGLPHCPAGAIPEDGNQLEFIIKRCKKGVRVSEFQASIFDPARDHTTAAQQGFPCLQHLTFVPSFGDGSLMLNAFYATQQLFEKGYGNFLGLSRLGVFVAGQVGLSLSRVNCFVGVEKMESAPPRNALLNALMERCERILRGNGAGGEQH